MKASGRVSGKVREWGRVRAGEGVFDDGLDRKILVTPDHNLMNVGDSDSGGGRVRGWMRG